MRTSPVLAAIALAVAVSPAAADPLADFYKGKQIELIIATETGTIYDSYGRLLAHHLSNHIPGRPPVIPKNMPGAGHIRAASYSFYAAPKDGTSIVTFSHNIPASFMMGNPAIKFDVGKFQWLGSPDLPGRMCVVRPEAKVHKAADLFDQEAIVAGAGASAAISQTPKLLRALLGMKFKLVEGYKGSSDAMLAVERGEVDGMCSTIEGILGARPGSVEEGKLRVLFNMERKPVPELKAPSIFDFAKTAEQRQILGFYGSTVEFGVPVAAPPGVPADHVEALRRALDATLKDPELLAEAARTKMKITPVTGEELAQRMEELVAMPPDIVRKAAELLGGSSG